MNPMKIDPCPCVISLKDGSVHTLFEFRHFLELVEDCMGYDAAKWLRTHVEQAEKAADYTQAKVDTDLTAYESDLESNRRAFQDIQAEAAAIITNNYLMVEKVTHNFKGDEHFMDLTLIGGEFIA